MPNIEGELKMNELGQFLVGHQTIHAGSIIEIKIQNEWVEVCIEQAHGTYYPIPQVDLSSGLSARVKDGL